MKLLVLIFTVFVLFSGSQLFADSGAVRRFGLIIGANDGGKDRVRLRYANRDAHAFAHVLSQLGGLGSNDLLVVTDASKVGLDRGIQELATMIENTASRQNRAEVIFYYSGHSDEQGLLLGEDTYNYHYLKQKVTSLPADVKILVLDSCASGSLTVAKGGLRKPAFLMDASIKTKGHAIITSSSSDEVAQESSRIKGSYFTHYLVSGLRGAADANNDQRITLNEAYQHAYLETLQRTHKTQKGPQHPSYDFRLAGTGQLVLTDLHQSTSLLFFPKDLKGRYYISTTQGELISEIKKIRGRPVQLGLEPGLYKIVQLQGSQYAEAEFELTEKQKINITSLQFKTLDGEPAVARGGKVYKLKTTSFQIIPDIDDLKHHNHEERHNFGFGLLIGHSGQIDGASLGILGYFVDEGGVSGAMVAGGLNFNHGPLLGAQVAGGANYTGMDSKGAQVAGGANVAGGNHTGAQVGNVNLAFKHVHGAQVGMLNYSKSLYGAQVGVANLLREGDGAQVGIFNYAEKFKGFQLAFATIAKENNGYSLGIVNYVGNGTLDVGISYDELEFTNFTLRMGGSKLYTIYNIGMRNVNAAEDNEMFGIGFGYKLRLDPIQFDVSLVGHMQKPEDDHFDDVDDDDEKEAKKKFNTRLGELRTFSRVQLTTGYRIQKFLVFIGLGLGTYTEDKDTFKDELAPNYKGMTSGKTSTSWLSYSAGLRYSFKN